MRKTITITDPMQVRVTDKAYFKDCDFGFTVTRVDADDKHSSFSVYNPLSGADYWILSSRFDHATREVKKQEWPDPHDIKLHIYLGADGKQYLYAPSSEGDQIPWKQLPYYTDVDWYDAEEMTKHHPEALPLKELKLVPVNQGENNA